MTVPVQKLSAQIVISWDGTSLRVEAPGRNGARQKIEGVYFDALPYEIQDTLNVQLDAARARARAELLQTQRENIAYVASAPGMGVGFARHIWKDANIQSRTMRARLAKAGQYDPITGKIKGADKPEKEILDLDI